MVADEGSEPRKRNGPITVFGGTGFLGQRLVRHLLRRGHAVRACSRHPERTSRIFNDCERLPEAVRVDIRDQSSISAALSGTEGAINAVSLYVEHSDATFHSVHVEAAERIARLANQHGVAQLVHISGIGSAPNASSRYIRARGEGELAVKAAFPNATILRSAVMIGRGDVFLTKIISLLRRLPIFPMFGNGRTRMQPVHVEDVGAAGARLATDPALQGQIYELGGPQIFDYEELLRTVARHLGLKRTFMPMPFGVWLALAGITEFAPGGPLTRNQVELMMIDNVASPVAPGFRELQIEPTPMEEVLRQIT